MGAIGIGRFITRIVIILLSGCLAKLLYKLLSKKESEISANIDKYSRSDLNQTMNERKQLKSTRIVLPIIIYSVVITICIIGLIFVMDYTEGEWADSALLAFITVIVVLFFNMINNIKEGNISTLEAKDLLSTNQSYTLYLRAFKSDRDLSSFSEKHFVRLLARNGEPKLYAVGLPNETDAPAGATRIYISDATWQQEVEELMQKATKIYLRVGDTEPCRWELGKSLLHKGKLIFIVDNISEYDAVRAEFPDLPQLQAIEGSFYLMRYLESENDWEIQKFKLSPKGYVNVTDNEAEYEMIVNESEKERQKLESLQINPKVGLVVFFAICSIIIGLYWYMRSNDGHCYNCYSMTLSYDIVSMGPENLGKQPVNKEYFEADNNYDAYRYAEKRFSAILDSLRYKYNGDLAHDDSIDLYTPDGFSVYNPKGQLIMPKTKSRSQLINEYTELNRNKSIHGAKWGMSIDDVQQLPYFSKWQRKDIVMHIPDTITISLLCDRDTLANHIFDEYLVFNCYYDQLLSGTILLSPQDIGNQSSIMQVYADVKFHLRKEYGAYRKYWDCKITNITCDTITYNDYSGVMVKTMYKGIPFKPLTNNDMVLAILEQLY